MRHMPRISGPWLAGTFDNDRAAAKAAVDALNLVFPSSEKIQGVRKAFQGSIIQYCRDALLHETIQTLSDERVVSSEDAAATYYRVLATSLSVINMLIVELPPEDQRKEDEVYNEVFSDARLWDAANSIDAAVRRAMHKLIRACLSKRPDIVQSDLKALSTAYVYKGLHSNQIGSAVDFVRTVLSATTRFPEVWTGAYSGKKTAISRLRHFLKQGSQSSAAEFWDLLKLLLAKLPAEILPTDVEETTELLISARAGVSKKEERINAAPAWLAYFKLVDIGTNSLPDADSAKILEAEVLPMLQQYLFQDSEKSEWIVSSPNSASVVSQIANIRLVTALLVRQWPGFVDRLIELVKMSQPEQSKDYERSQNNVFAAGERWAKLQHHIWTLEPAAAAELIDALDACNTKIFNECSSIIKDRNGKPYGAAGIIEHMLRSNSDHLLSLDGFRTSYSQFLEKDLPDLVFSPSGKHLVHGLLATQLPPVLSPLFAHLLSRITEADTPTETKLAVLRTVFKHDTPNTASLIAQDVPEFQKFAVHTFAADSKDGSAALFAELVKSGAVTTETADAVLSQLTASLSVADESQTGLSALDHISRNNQTAIRMFVATPGGSQLLPNLLHLEQSPNDQVAEQAAALSSRLSSTITEATPDARFAVVLQNLEKTSRMSMPIDAVHELTMRLIGSERSVIDLSEILPSLELWSSAFLAVLEPPAPSLALMSVLGGAVHFVEPSDNIAGSEVLYDAEGFSQALRIAMFVSKVLTETDTLEHLNDLKATTFAMLQLSVIVAEDNVSVTGSNKIWRKQSSVESEAAILDFISEANVLLAKYLEQLVPELDADTASESGQFFSALETMRADATASSPLSYYVSVGVARVYSNLFEIHGFSTHQMQKCEEILKGRRSQDQQIDQASYIIGFQQPLSGTPTLTKLLNELVAHLTDADAEKDQLSFFSQICLLNNVLRTQDQILDGIPKQRIIFLIKPLIVSLESPIDVAIKAEIFRALIILLTGVGDMYGEHWEQAIGAIIGIWTMIATESEHGAINESHVLLENATLRLYAALRKLTRYEEPNDDLIEGLKEKEAEIQKCLVKLLTAADGLTDENHQPLRITHELLARQLAATPMHNLGNLDEIYSLVYAPSRSIQQAAFELLHREIPAAQEKTSLDAALDNKTAQLPQELLSLILEAPTLESLADSSFQSAMPLPLQGYLYSWRLVFDHFEGSSYKVKSDYIEQLKEGTYLAGLLKLTFDFLGHTNGRPADVSKFNMRHYTSDEEPNPEKDVQWLLAHLYYLALTHLPGLVRSYYLDIRSRQLPQVIEIWTAKHVSALIIEQSLKDVLEWSDKPKEDPEYEKVTFKVGFRSREITSSYEVDEQIMSMKIVLPEAYPLASAQVIGINRVAVNEERWQSWLRNCQGVIAFSVSGIHSTECSNMN